MDGLAGYRDGIFPFDVLIDPDLPLPSALQFETNARDAANDDSDPSSFEHWLPVLEKLPIGHDDAWSINERAMRAGVPFQCELLASGVVEEDALFRALAAEFGLSFIQEIDPEALIMRHQQCTRALKRRGGAEIAMVLEAGGKIAFLISPSNIDIARMRRHLRRYPEVAGRLRIVSPSILRNAVMRRVTPRLTRNATDGLSDTQPASSARIVVNGWQGAMVGAFIAVFPFCLALALSATMTVVHWVASVFFLSCVVLRVTVSAGTGRERRLPLKPIVSSDMPVYTVLVALYREADIVPDLLVALGKIVWPRSKLEIKLVCEADDEKTLAAIRAHDLRPYIEVVEVPPSHPRTKPKALSYALPVTSGDFVVLYDAEDKPHPFQLVEAWQKFSESGGDLACLQAPLHISNPRESRISALFALEYAALFRGILPWLAKRELLLPLGGTSNHFRRAALEDVGAWDPCNVTEDADLGLRLKRFGYKAGTIFYPTFEDAPADIRTWLPQRTRWFKGWAQTWLVHMRSPSLLGRDLGFSSFVIVQILFAGMIVSALVHPLFLATIGFSMADLLLGGVLGSQRSGLLAVDIVNIACGYTAFLALGWQTLKREERKGFWKLVVLTPFYWSLMSVAAWHSLWQLYRRPFHWSKTPHVPRRDRRKRTA